MEPAITNINIVLIGKFKPDNFMPSALAKSKVISQKAAELASFVSLIPQQLVSFKLDWSMIEVTTNRFVIYSVEAPHIRICDAVLKALRETDPDSIVSQFGINVDCHYDLGSPDARNDLGKRLAPPEAWGEWGAKILETMDGKYKGTPLQGGMMNILMRHPFVHETGLTGWRDVTVAASASLQSRGGVLCRSNHHHQIKSLVPAEGEAEIAEPTYDSKTTELLLSALAARFEKSIEASISIFEGVIAS